ncbi:helix-turn-helix transcriptional regulator [Cribrihabitans sp. XS_ASV171]
MSTDFGTIISRIIDTITYPENWTDLCNDITERMSGTAFMVFEYDVLEGRGFSFHGSSELFHHGNLIDKLTSGGGEIDHEIYFALTRSPPGDFATEAELLGLSSDHEITTNPYRDAVLAALGSKSRSGGRLNDVGPWMDVAAFHSPVLGQDLPHQLRSDFAILLPAIAKAIEGSRVVRSLSRQYGALLELFDRLDFAVGFCDERRRLVLSNEAFKRMTRDGDTLVMDGDTLSSNVPDAQHNLASAFSAAWAIEAGPQDTVTTLQRRSGRRPLILKLLMVSGRSIEWSTRPLAMVVVLDPEDDGRISASGLAAFDLLTPAELDVCDLLVRGIPTEEIAERRSTSLATTRNQVKSAANKMGCSRRVDLLRLALATHCSVESAG